MELLFGELTLGKFIRLFEGGAMEGAVLQLLGFEFVGERLRLRSLFWSCTLDRA